MAEHLILFKTDMVDSINAGIKNQTRRLITERNSRSTSKLQELNFKDVVEDDFLTPNREGYLKVARPDDTRHRVFCKYEVGDILLVKETWCYAGYNNVQDGKENYYDVIYRASENGRLFEQNFDGWRWKSPLFLKKADVRIKLEITGVRAEQLAKISDTDCIGEGIAYWGGKSSGYFKDYDKSAKSDIPMSARGSYMSLWDSINGNGNFATNPYVWVIDFKVK